jgi:two-component system, OmpR family, response regulator
VGSTHADGGSELQATLIAGGGEPLKVGAGESLKPGDPAKTIAVQVDRVFVASNEPLPVGSLIAVDLRLGTGPSLRTLARVTESVPVTEASEARPAGMRLHLLDVWGERATAQVAEYVAEASRTASPDNSWMAAMRVLVVDDDKHYRDAAATVMREAGFEVLTACNGFEALSMALKHQPSAIVTDVTMPDMDGWQLLRMVRARPTLRRTPVVFLTELNSESERLRGYQLGVDDYLGKPFDGVELTARVERVLERSHAAQEAQAHGMHGDLSRVSLASLLSLADMERRSGVLQLLHEGERATLHLRDGAVVRIDLSEQFDGLKGAQRFFHVLDWQHGSFELVHIEVLANDTLQLPTSYVLLEHARISDENKAKG